MYYDDDATLNFIVGVAIGAILGAGVALLLAPQAGRKTRKRLRRTAEEWGETAGERLQSAASDVRRVAEDARKAAERSGDRVKDSVKKGRQKLSF